jgi:hypothetical protein
MKSVIILLGLVLIGGITYYLVFGISPQTTENTPAVNAPTMGIKESVSPATRNDLLAGGSSYSDPDGVYVFLYPNEYKLDTQDSLHIRIYKTGATQQGQTEMYDGVIMVFETIELNGQTLNNWVDGYIKTSTADGTMETIDEKKSVLLNSYSGFTYQLRGLGESKYVVIQRDDNSDKAVLITYSVSDPENKNYQAEVDNILSTFQLLQ